MGDADFDFENFYFGIVLDPKFPDFQVPRLPDSQTEVWAKPGPTWAGPGPEIARAFSATAPDHKVVEIQGTRAKP